MQVGACDSEKKSTLFRSGSVLFFFCRGHTWTQAMLARASMRDGPDGLRVGCWLDSGFVLSCGIDITWQDDSKDAALSRDALSFNMSTMTLNDLAGNVEAQTQTVSRARLHLDTRYAIELL